MRNREQTNTKAKLTMPAITLTLNRNARGWQWLLRWPGGRRESIPGVWQPADSAEIDVQALRRWMLSSAARAAAADSVEVFAVRLSAAIPELETRLDWADLVDFCHAAVSALGVAQASAARDAAKCATVAQVLACAAERADSSLLRGVTASIGNDSGILADSVDLSHVSEWARRMAAGGAEYENGTIAGPWNRQTIRSGMRRLVGAFRLAAASQLCAVETAQRIEFAVRSLDLAAVPSGNRITAVPAERVEQTIPHLPQSVQTLVRIQLFTGCRPGEACAANVAEIDRSRGDVWLYTPEHHKTSYRGRSRTIIIGPKCVELLSPIWPIAEQRSGGWLVVTSTGRPYLERVYARDVRSACLKHGIEPWRPNQIRHTVATDARNGHGVDGEAAFLGHTAAVAREWYCERDLERAIQIAKQIG